jgi:hypothetical protein
MRVDIIEEDMRMAAVFQAKGLKDFKKYMQFFFTSCYPTGCSDV